MVGIPAKDAERVLVMSKPRPTLSLRLSGSLRKNVSIYQVYDFQFASRDFTSNQFSETPHSSEAPEAARELIDQLAAIPGVGEVCLRGHATSREVIVIRKDDRAYWTAVHPRVVEVIYDNVPGLSSSEQEASCSG